MATDPTAVTAATPIDPTEFRTILSDILKTCKDVHRETGMASVTAGDGVSRDMLLCANALADTACNLMFAEHVPTWGQLKKTLDGRTQQGGLTFQLMDIFAERLRMSPFRFDANRLERALRLAEHLGNGLAQLPMISGVAANGDKEPKKLDASTALDPKFLSPMLFRIFSHDTALKVGRPHQVETRANILTATVLAHLPTAASWEEFIQHLPELGKWNGTLASAILTELELKKDRFPDNHKSGRENLSNRLAQNVCSALPMLIEEARVTGAAANGAKAQALGDALKEKGGPDDRSPGS